jgi:hypothetical protein
MTAKLRLTYVYRRGDACERGKEGASLELETSFESRWAVAVGRVGDVSTVSGMFSEP